MFLEKNFLFSLTKMANVDTSLYDTTCTRVNRENTRWKIWLIYTHSPTRVNEWEEFLPIRAWEVILPIAQKRFRGKINGKKNFPLLVVVIWKYAEVVGVFVWSDQSTFVPFPARTMVRTTVEQ